MVWGAARRCTTAARAHEGSADDVEYDLFTIGGGSAGVRAARYSAGMGTT